MNKFVIVVFPDEPRAYQGVHELGELHEEGSVTVFGSVVVERDAKGALSIQRRSEYGPLGLGVEALAGGLIGLFAGPVGAAGGPAGSWRDYLHAEVSDEFLDEIQRELTPGRFAVIADVSEEWIAPVDTRMEALGGKVVRESRQDFADDLLQKRADARSAELAQRKAERASARAARMEAKLTAKVEDAQEKLQRTAEKARERLDHTKHEVEAKLRALEEQASKAKPEVRGRIEQRIAELRKDFAEREKKLARAYELTQQALHP